MCISFKYHSMYRERQRLEINDRAVVRKFSMRDVSAISALFATPEVIDDFENFAESVDFKRHTVRSRIPLEKCARIGETFISRLATKRALPSKRSSM